MNYIKIYNDLIENRKFKQYDEYTEIHHIIPRSFGGDNSKENLMELSLRDHYFAHCLLWKHYKNNHDIEKYTKMCFALNLMISGNKKNNKVQIKSRLYSFIKKEFSSIQVKPVLQYDINGRFIKKWNSTSEVLKFYNKNISITDSCINFNSNVRRNGFLWRYYDGKEIPIKIHGKIVKPKQYGNIYKMTIDGTIISTYTSINKAAKDNNLQPSEICMCLNSGKNICGGYYWKREQSIIV